MTVEVTLVDGATGQVFAQTAMAAEDLPEDFGLATELTIGKTVWRVESAVPRSRAEYGPAGTLRLVLRKAAPVQLVDPAELYFSMSSICDVLPPDGASCGDRVPLVVDGDLWRDVELVGPGHEAAIEENFAAVRRIHAEHSVGLGFSKIHVRGEPRAPLDAVGLTVAQLGLGLGSARVDPVTIEGYAGCIPGGFSLALGGGLAVYGQENDGVVVVIAVERSARDASAAAAALFALMSEHRLSLVDWRGCLRVDDEAGLMRWLGEVP